MKIASINLFLVSLAILLGGCALPKPHFAQSRSYEEFLAVASSPPQFQWAYCGSDEEFHHFAQWRYGAMLFHSGKSSYLKRHKVRRKEMVIKDEFPRTNDMKDWRIYSLMGGDRDGRFSKDFLREGDKVQPVSYE